MKGNLCVAIIGAGLIGRKRALSLPDDVKLLTVFDVNQNLAKKFSLEFKCKQAKSLEEILNDQGIGSVIVATPNASLAEIGRKVIERQKNVLIEKPGGRNSKDIEILYSNWKKNPVVVRIGYNHRFHPALQKAKELCDSQKYGSILFIRAKYGHGGRIGYEKEWRFKKALSGGGELVDQGSHLIDLTNFFVGELRSVKSTTKTFFWKTTLEDSAFMILENNNNQTALLSASCVEWKNIFCFEIMLENAKIQIDGLGGSYGTEKLTLYKMRPEMGPPDVEEFIFDQPDQSWKIENQIFFNDIKNKNYSKLSFQQAFYVFAIIEKVYAENK